MALEVLARATVQQKEMKGVQIIKKDIKQTLYPDDMPLYTENSKDYIKKTVKTTTSYWIQIDIQKSTAFLSTNSKLPEREMKKEIPFTRAPITT